MTGMIQHTCSLVLIVLLLHGRMCLGANCYCFNADELDTDDIHTDKCLSSCSTCSEDYVFIYKFNVTGSCVGRCGQKLNRNLPCQCNKPCKRHNDCCKDYDVFCLESCIGRCGQPYESSLPCQCNTDCKNGKENKECCHDFDAFCQEDVEPFRDEPQFCDNGNFIKWNPLKSCNNFDQKMNYRTGETSSSEPLRSTDYEENGEWKALQCEGGDISEDLLLVKSSSYECSNLVSFYCRNGYSPQKSVTTVKSPESNFTTTKEPGQNTPPIKRNTTTGSSSQESITAMESQERNVTTQIVPGFTLPIKSYTGVIIGIVSSIITIGVVIFVVIVCRRRRSARRNPVLKQDAHGPNDTEMIEHLENKNNYAYSEIEMEATNKNDHMDNADNEYTTGPSDVYDHLNENKNRKIKTEDPHAIYDHAIGDNAEPDYDTTKHVVPTNPDYQEVIIRSENEINSEKL